LIQRLYTYEPNETKSSYLGDNTLVGLINLITILFESDASILSPGELESLVTMLVEKCLFCFQFNPIASHITMDVDLAPIEKKQINKCHAKESVQSAYTLLVALCKSQVVPNLTEGIIEKYWVPQINSVDKPQKPGFQPSADCRSWNNYCGIKNLGAVCYMNSMMQQFFNEPSFRYCLLAANDEVKADMQEHEGEEVDDNFLHQMMNMFGFLVLSDRQYYNPTPLCFSFKSFDGMRTNVREQKDAQEFLIAAFDKLESHLKDTSQKYLLQNAFGLQTCQMLRCKNCGDTRSNLEDHFFLSFEVKNQSSIFDGLRRMVSPEIISDW
jgi:ubiquitin carboxyl-terminal hydrolase 34